jgi:two-component system, OmpR family, response regulator
MTPTLAPGPPLDRAAPEPLRPRLLVVDDEPSIRELLFLALRFEGWDVRTAEDGAEAVRTAREFSPDAVLLDMMLPDMDGFEVLRRLRAEAPRLPVVFVTARDAPADRAAGLAAGGDDYVTKPFGLDDVVTRLRRLLPAG